uniref:Uncharacterized protein n=1 Tax=Tetraselmis sp. GSL018 TaxID=582737 RepID=A0A061SGU6_9CHLO
MIETDWLLRLKGPKNLQEKYITWLGRTCLLSDIWAISLYAMVCTVMSATTWPKAGSSGVPSFGLLLTGLSIRLFSCLCAIVLRLRWRSFYLQQRIRILLVLQLVCHCSGMLLEAPATFWYLSSTSDFRFATPLVGQVFEVVGFRVPFLHHVIRALLDFGLSYFGLMLNVRYGWASDIVPRTSWPLVMVCQYVVSGFGLMTLLEFWLEQRTLRKFLGHADLHKLSGAEHQDQGLCPSAFCISARLPGSLRLWRDLHHEWVPVCTSVVASLKFDAPRFADLGREVRAGICNAMAESHGILCSVTLFDGCIQAVVSGRARAGFAAAGSPATLPPGGRGGAGAQSGAGSSGSAAGPGGGALRCVKDMLGCVPADWVRGGRVTGYAEGLGVFECSGDNGIDFPAAQPAPPAIVGVAPLCGAMRSPGLSLQFRLLCEMSGGDPLICLQDGDRIPLSIVRSTRMESSDARDVYEVTVEVLPKGFGYIEFHVMSKARLMPLSSALRTVDLDQSADIAYSLLGSLPGDPLAQAGEAVSPAAPALVFEDLGICKEICSVFGHQGALLSSDSGRSSCDSFGPRKGGSSDGIDSVRSCELMDSEIVFGSGMESTSDEDSSADSRPLTPLQKHTQLSPPLILCGVVAAFFRLSSAGGEEGFSKRSELLISRNVKNMDEWRDLVQDCILFLARSGMARTVMFFLSHVEGLDLCPAPSNLLHYAVASGSVELVRRLVSKYGAAVSTASDYGTTPLHLAAAIDDVEMLVALLSDAENCRLAVEARDTAGRTALDYAYEAKLEQNIHLIMESHRRCQRYC